VIHKQSVSCFLINKYHIYESNLYNIASFFYLDFKLDANTQSILEKILEEQLKQSTMIDILQDEVSKNHKLLEKIQTALTSGSLIMKTEEHPKQRLKRKDTKHLWWDVSTET